MKSKQQKPQPYKQLIFYGILASILLYEACRKIDYGKDKQLSIDKDRTEEFFNIPVNTNPLVKSIANRIKGQNDSAHFVNKLVKKIGFPIWNKSMIASSSNIRQNKSNYDSIMNYTYIPFGLDSIIKATLIIRTSPDDTLMRLVNDWEYEMAGFDTASGNDWNANDLFHVFGIFEKEVYGHKSFAMLDHRFTPTLDSEVIAIATFKDNPAGKNLRSNLLVSITMCDYIDYCYAPPGQAMCNGGECTESCDQYLYTGTDCSTFWVEDGWGGGGPPYIPWSSGGGGGGSGPWWGNVCTQQGAFCGNVGWLPVAVDSFLANYANQGYKHFEHWSVVNGDNNKINDWKANNIDTTGLDECVKSVLDKLLDNNNLIGKILVKMDQSNFRVAKIKNFKIKIQVATIADSLVLGRTLNGHFNTTTGVYTDTVIINSTSAGTSTELSIAQTLMHEIVHAYMKMIFFAYYYSSFNGAQIQTMNVNTMFSTYIDSMMAIHTYSGLNSWNTGNHERDHNFMADKLISIFTSALEKIDGSAIANKRYYWFMAWQGLMSTNTMSQVWPNFPSWPPGNPAPNDDSTRGLKYALTQSRLDSIRKALFREAYDTAKALGKKRHNPGCYNLIDE